MWTLYLNFKGYFLSIYELIIEAANKLFKAISITLKLRMLSPYIYASS